MVSTDHKPLTKFLTMEGFVSATVRIARFSVRLQDFLFDILYVPGAKNVTVDCLRRLALPLTETDLNSWNDYSVANVFKVNLLHDSIYFYEVFLHPFSLIIEYSSNLKKCWNTLLLLALIKKSLLFIIQVEMEL